MIHFKTNKGTFAADYHFKLKILLLILMICCAAYGIYIKGKIDGYNEACNDTIEMIKK